MKLLFICHRPYHVVRSAQFANSIRSTIGNVSSTIVAFDVYDFSGGRLGTDSQLYNSFGYLFNYSAFFDDAIEMERGGEKRIWNIWAFLRYYKRQARISEQTLDKIGPVDSVFFFSDKEKPVELLVSLARERYGSKTYLIDEGVVSYAASSKWAMRLLKFVVVKLFHLRHISSSYSYGRSRMYDYSLSIAPEKSVLTGLSKFRLPPLDSDEVAAILRKPIETIGDRYILYVSSALEQSVGVPPQVEVSFLKELALALKRIGYELVIKPHPVEPRGKYEGVTGAEVIADHLFPVELLFNPRAVILSAISSTLINAKKSGIRAATIGKLMNIDSHDLATLTEVHRIFCPNTLQELLSYVSSPFPASLHHQHDGFEEAFFNSLNSAANKQ